MQPSIIKEIAQVLRRIRDERGVSILFSEQVLSFVMDAAERIMVIENGRIVHEDNRDDVDEKTLIGYLSVLAFELACKTERQLYRPVELYLGCVGGLNPAAIIAMIRYLTYIISATRVTSGEVIKTTKWVILFRQIYLRDH